MGKVKNLFKSEQDKGIYEMPFEAVGQIMLFKVYERVSYGIVTQNDQPIYVGDKVQTPK